MYLYKPICVKLSSDTVVVVYHEHVPSAGEEEELNASK
jgi:hypothetical protein